MKKFLWKICPFILFILVLEIAIPMAVDPYNVFHWRQIRDNGVEPNSNYIKMEYILHNPDKFDSFLFGSSRTGFVNVDRIPEGKWYNMSYDVTTSAAIYRMAFIWCAKDTGDSGKGSRSGASCRHDVQRFSDGSSERGFKVCERQGRYT